MKKQPLKRASGPQRRSKAATSQAVSIAIGIRLKHARLTQSITLRELAELVGCTESFLSKVENDKAHPSFTTLHRVATALGINVGTLFVQEVERDGPVSIGRPDERPKILTHSLRMGRGITLESLISNAVTRLLEANIHHIEPGCSTDGLIQHEGEEIGYVLKGQIELSVADRTYALEQGDSFFFMSTHGHGYRNTGQVSAAILWVNTPKSF
jgi:transcriptional regulator with XRE-family HTH domain